MKNSITYLDGWGKSHTFPTHAPHCDREGNCLDVCIRRHVAVDCPLVVTLSITTDGQIRLMHVDWDHPMGNTYWHFACASEEKLTGLICLGKQLRAPVPPTPAQQAILARMWLGPQAADPVTLPGDLDSSLGRPVAQWAFQGLTHDEVTARWGKPETKVYLTAPCDGNENIITGPEQKDTEDEIARKEAYLEQACEEGQIPGAL